MAMKIPKEKVRKKRAGTGRIPLSPKERRLAAKRKWSLKEAGNMVDDRNMAVVAVDGCETRLRKEKKK